MKNLTTILTEEHQVILQVADAMTRECRKIEQGEGLDKTFFDKAIDFIRNYADKFHHAKEENILFKEADNTQEAMHCDPREQMLYEHDIGRDLVKNLEKAVEQGNKDEVINNARGYADLIQDHIFKEDNILYPMLDTAIPDERQQAMLKLAAQAEEEHFKGTKEKYLAIAEEFSKR